MLIMNISKWRSGIIKILPHTLCSVTLKEATLPADRVSMVGLTWGESGGDIFKGGDLLSASSTLLAHKATLQVVYRCCRPSIAAIVPGASCLTPGEKWIPRRLLPLCDMAAADPRDCLRLYPTCVLMMETVGLRYQEKERSLLITDLVSHQFIRSTNWFSQ